MRNKIYNILFVGLLMLMISCGDIIDADLSKDKIELVAPGDSIITTSSEIKFLWEANEEAVNYSFQLVSPSFDKVEELVLDVLLDDNNTEKTLPEGKYSWRVKANNSSTKTRYASRYFEIIKDLSREDIEVLSPADDLVISIANDAVISSADIIFQWSLISGARDYRLEIASPSFSQSEKILLDTILVEERVSKTLGIGKYEWRIKARNAKTESKYIYRRIEIQQNF
jgi:predicted secreted protein